MNKEKKFVSVIIYVHNAEERVGALLGSVIAWLEEHFEQSEIICVNDFSVDGSVQEIKKASTAAKQTAISVLNMSCFHGMEVAMNAGVDLSIGDFVFEIDTTVQDYHMDELMRIYRKALEGYDIVSAVPNRRQRLSSAFFYKMYEKFSDDGAKLHSESFRVVSRRAINRLNSMSRTVPYRKALYAGCGLKMTSLSYEPLAMTKMPKEERQMRRYRQSLAVDSLILFTNAGYACAKLMTVAMMFASLFMLMYTIVIYAMAKPVAGWTTTVLFLSFAFFGLFAILTVIVKYLQILLNLSFKTVKFNFENVEKLTK